MINKDVMLNYVRIVNEYMSNPTFVFSEEDRNIINSVNRASKEDGNLARLLEELRNTSDKNAVIEKYFNPDQSNKSDENVEEVIANTFGIDISNIEHKYLNNGNEIFAFYDVNSGKKILLENNKNGVSLVEQLKEIQANNSNYQTQNDEKNATDILNDKILKENCELSMISVEEVPSRLMEMSALSLEDYYKILFLYKNANSIGLSYINFDNAIGIDNDGKIFEVYKDSSYEYKIGEPNNASYKDDKINVSDRIDESYTSSEQNVALQSNYEDIPTEIEDAPLEEEIKFDTLPDDIKEKTIMLYKMPHALDELPNEAKDYWLQNIELYKKKLEIEERKLNEKKNVNVRRLTLENSNNNKGNIDFVSITFILGIIFTIISMVIVFAN